jgi:DNA-binding transcriptional regulator/RsmH inhibitor MraZ
MVWTLRPFGQSLAKTIMRILTFRRSPVVVACAFAGLLIGVMIVTLSLTGVLHRAPFKSKIIISKETSYLLGPTDKHGQIDYVAAINETARKGVTPENNAVVLLWGILGPKGVPAEIREPYFKLLGVPVPPEQGQYFQPPSDELTELLYQASQRPWNQKDYPEVAKWLQANDQFVERLDVCSNQPRYYSPSIAGKEGPRAMGVVLPATQSVREFARSLSARAMKRVQEGKLDEAFRDSLALHRLARLVGQGGTLVEMTVCTKLDFDAEQIELAIAASDKISAKQAREYATELKKLPALPSISEILRTFERFMLLDAVASFERDQAERLASSGLWEKLGLSLDAALVDPNDELRSINRWSDRIANDAAEPSAVKRREAAAKLHHDLKKLAADIKAAKPTLAEIADGEVSRRAGDIFVTMLLPDLAKAFESEDSDRQRLDLVLVAFALAAYHADHVSYPQKFAELVPKYISEVPNDTFSERELTYRPDVAGYLLYSFGPNGIDDGGHDSDSDPTGDDIVVRVPPQVAPK